MKQYKPEKLSVLEQRGGSFAMSKMFVGSIEERRKAFNTFIKDNSDDSKTVLRHRKIIQLKYLEKKEKANKQLNGIKEEEWMWVCKSDTFKNDDSTNYKLCNKFGEPLNNVDVINTIWDKAEKEVIDGTGMTLTLANNPGHHAIHDLLTMSLGIYDLFFLYTVYLFDATSKEQEKDRNHKRRLIKDQIVHAYNYDIVAKQKKELEKYITQFNELQKEYNRAQEKQEIKKPKSLRMTYYTPITGVEAIHAYMQLKKEATKIKQDIWSLEQSIPPEKGLDDRTDEQKKKWDQSQNEMTIRIDQRNKIQQLKKRK